jgi:hypothetical protein
MTCMQPWHRCHEVILRMPYPEMLAFFQRGNPDQLSLS